MADPPKASNFREKNQFSQGRSGGNPIKMMKKPRTNPKKGGGINRALKSN